MCSVAKSARPSGCFWTTAFTTFPTKIEWSPFSTVCSNVHSTYAGTLRRIGAPVLPEVYASPLILSPSFSTGLKKAKAGLVAPSQVC